MSPKTKPRPKETPPPFHAGSLQYLGGIRTPHEESFDVTPLPGGGYGAYRDGMYWGGRQFALDPRRREFVIGTRYWRVARLTMVDPRFHTGTDVNTFPVVPYATDVMVELSGTPLLPASPKDDVASWYEMDANLEVYGCAPAGYLPYGLDKMLASGCKYFDTNNTTRRAFFVADWPAHAPASTYRLNRTLFKTVGDELAQGYIGGAMCAIPARYQEALKGDVLAGNSNLPIIYRGSAGPAATSFWGKDLVDKEVVPATLLVGYPSGHHMPEHPWNNPEADPIYNQATSINGMAIVGDTLVFVGAHGYGKSCYGSGTSDPDKHETTEGGEHYCFDPANSYKGCHAYPYRIQLWHYPVADLIAVVKGEKAPWDLRPEWFELEVPFFSPQCVTGACGFDEETKRLYVSVYSADGYGYEPGPVLYAWQYDGEVPKPPDPPDPPDPPEPPDGACTDPECLAQITELEQQVADLTSDLSASEAALADANRRLAQVEHEAEAIADHAGHILALTGATKKPRRLFDPRYER